MTQTMKYKTVLLKILLPTLLCSLTVINFNIAFIYHPIAIGLIIGVFNWDVYKINPISGFILSIMILYIAYFIIKLIFLIIGISFHIFPSPESVIAITLSGFILLPLLIYHSYGYLFNCPKTKFTTWIKFFSITSLAIYSFITFNAFSRIMSIPINFAVENKLLNPYALWQIVLVFSLQLIIYQNVIFKGSIGHR